MLWQYSRIVVAPITRLAPRAFKERLAQSCQVKNFNRR